MPSVASSNPILNAGCVCIMMLVAPLKCQCYGDLARDAVPELSS